LVTELLITGMVCLTVVSIGQRQMILNPKLK